MDRDTIFVADNVAVITGAALGIGRAMAQRCAQLGMHVLLADLDSVHLDEALHTIQKNAVLQNRISAYVTDVSDPLHVQSLYKTAIEQFGKVNFLANNAVSRAGKGFDVPLDEWRSAMDVNLWGPIYGVQAFLPAMLEHPDPAAIVNVGSKQGITNPPGHPIYNMSKSALKTYTESLQHALRNNPDNHGDGRVSSHLLVPGWTTTGKAEHKPGAWLPSQVVEEMIQAVARDDFYIICPDDEVTAEMDRKRILWGAQDITENRPPLSRWHAEFAEQANKACS